MVNHPRIKVVEVLHVLIALLRMGVVMQHGFEHKGLEPTKDFHAWKCNFPTSSLWPSTSPIMFGDASSPKNSISTGISKKNKWTTLPLSWDPTPNVYLWPEHAPQVSFWYLNPQCRWHCLYVCCSTLKMGASRVNVYRWSSKHRKMSWMCTPTFFSEGEKWHYVVLCIFHFPVKRNVEVKVDTMNTCTAVLVFQGWTEDFFPHYKQLKKQTKGRLNGRTSICFAPGMLLFHL